VAESYFDRSTELQDAVIPIGYPTPGNRFWLVSEEGKEVEPGEVGEIVVQNGYLAAGYWNQPELTAARFRQVPYLSHSPVYFTGDLGRQRPDGSLLHLGRKDFQIKVRGYQVQANEVEARLLEIPGVREAAVVASDTDSGVQRLVAYIQPERGSSPSVSLLRRALSDELPSHMVPQRYVFVDIMPKTPTGKIQRSQLPPPGRDRPALDTAFVPPRTPLEARLAAVWADVLDLDEVGVHDAFLELGGDSLQATRIVSRVVDGFQVDLSLHDLFESATVAEMASRVFQHLAQRAGEAEIQAVLEQNEG
jgi:hypothetical protein